MKIVMTLLVRDNEDILRQNIDFHLKMGVDFFIATDNKSIDCTPSILKEYQKKGSLKYLFESEDTYNQTAWVTKMARMAYKEYCADWVINNDADEFWLPLQGNLKDVLRNLKDETNVLCAQRQNFVCVNFNENETFYNRMIYKEKQSVNSLGMPLPPKVMHRGSNEVVVAQGNHDVAIGKKVMDSIDIDILHFPIRSPQQFVNKIRLGGAAFERNKELKQHSGRTWRVLYEKLIENGNLDDFFCDNIYTREKISRALENNDLLVDQRLKNVLNELF